MLSERILTPLLRFVTRDAFQLEENGAVDLPGPRPDRRYMLYVHIPFCDVLCPYCSFNRFAYKENAARTYFVSLREEMRMTAALGYHFQSLYFGGGTPTILLDELILTIDLAKELFGIKDISCETNPNQLEPALAERLAGRVQRMSVGVQSFDNTLLHKVSRLERFGDGELILKRIHSVEGLFDSLNVDIIFNFPGQTREVLLRDIELAKGSGANQITFYPLMSPRSVVKSLKQTVGVVTYDSEYEDYQLILEKMSPEFEQTTGWAFSRKNGGLIDEYIVDTEEYVGIGSGAFSYLDGTIYVNSFSLKSYGEAIEAGRRPVMGSKSYSHHNQMRYHFLMDLFGSGLDRKKFRERFGVAAELGLPMELSYFTLNGALDFSDSRVIRLTARGRYLFIVMMREFFIGINEFRDQARQALNPEDGTERSCAGANGLETIALAPRRLAS
jgi:coproporphyrinogen III oxidase-like Fe-S oxidoreductase